MRKLVSLALIAMLMCLLSVSAAAETVDCTEEMLPVVAGEWKVSLFYDSTSEIAMDSTNVVRADLIIGEDGAAELNFYDSMFFNEMVYNCTVSSIEDDAGTYYMYLNDAATGESVIMLLYDHEGGNIGMFFSDYLVFFTKDYTPAAEIAPAVAAASADDVIGMWCVDSASVDGRAVDMSMSLIPVYHGQPWELYGDSLYVDGSAVLIDGSTAITEEGSILYTGIDSETGSEITFEFKALEDGTLYVDYSGVECILMEAVIDPMTEYTDTESIMFAQEALNARGYDCGTPDGISGKNTAAALSAFQTDNGLTVTGTLTHETYVALH